MIAKSRPAARLLGLLVLGATVSLLLASCGTGDPRSRDSNGRLVPSARQSDPASTHYSDLMDQANSGDCNPDVIATLTCYSFRGHGYEGAQTALGQCLLKNNKTSEGVEWLTRAANAGWPDAQKALAGVYLSDKAGKPDPVQAGKWAYLYLKNPSLFSLGVSPDSSIKTKIQENLSQSQLIEARTMAGEWAPQYWQPKTTLDEKTAAACYVAPARVVPQLPAGMIDDKSQYPTN